MQLQRDFRAALTGEDPTDAWPAERLDIYRGSVLECKASALRETYPLVEALVGEDFFTGMAYAYVSENPSRSPDLGEYGASLPSFIQHFKPAAGLSYLPDMARLDWAIHQAYRAKNEAEMDFAALSAVPEDQQGALIFQLPASATLLAACFPVYTIWQAVHGGQHTEAMDLNQAQRVIVWRAGFEQHVALLTDLQWRFLQQVQAQKTLGEIAEAFVSADCADPFQAIFATCLSSGWLVLL